MMETVNESERVPVGGTLGVNESDALGENVGVAPVRLLVLMDSVLEKDIERDLPGDSDVVGVLPERDGVPIVPLWVSGDRLRDGVPPETVGEPILLVADGVPIEDVQEADKERVGGMEKVLVSEKLLLRVLTADLDLVVDSERLSEGVPMLPDTDGVLIEKVDEKLSLLVFGRLLVAVGLPIELERDMVFFEPLSE